MLARPALRTLPGWLAALALAGSACSSRPSPFTVEPAEAEAIRAELGTIAVAYLESAGTLELVEPARGWWGGLKRGAYAGAMTPIVIGFLTPVPGGTLFGALAAPFTAALGAGYGMIVAPSTETVEVAEVGLDAAIDRLLATPTRAASIRAVAERATTVAGRDVAALDDVPAEEDGGPDLSQPTLEGVDTLVLLGPTDVGLAGEKKLNPPLTAFLEARVRVVRTSDAAVLYDYEITCTDVERTWKQWGADEGQAFSGALLNCLPHAIEKIADDLLLVYVRPGDGE